jgi:hypothetical protein
MLRNGEISLNSPLFIILFYQKFLEIGSGDFFYRLNVRPMQKLPPINTLKLPTDQRQFAALRPTWGCWVL